MDSTKEKQEDHFLSQRKQACISRSHNKSDSGRIPSNIVVSLGKETVTGKIRDPFSEQLQAGCFRSLAEVTTGVSSPAMERFEGQ